MLGEARGVRAFIGLGSNLDDPVRQLLKALDALGQLSETERIAYSRLYRSVPLGPPGQPDYVNAVVALDTRLSPLALLRELQAIEQAQGRERHEHWGARTLDLDLLLYGGLVMHSAPLTIPHPEMEQRNFVLYPLYEVEPELVMPDGRTLPELLVGCSEEGLERLA